jgi:hypothetical protein
METTFQKSDNIVNLTKALMTFSVKIDKIKKEASNPFFKSKYATLPQIQEAIAEPLQESGLVLVQLPDGDGLLTMLLLTRPTTTCVVPHSPLRQTAPRLAAHRRDKPGCSYDQHCMTAPAEPKLA